VHSVSTAPAGGVAVLHALPVGFLLALCQPGAEKALVDELAPAGWVRAFSKKGLVTLKGPEVKRLDDVPAPVFARHVGVSLDRVTSLDQARVRAKGLGFDVDDDAVRFTVVDDGWASIHRHRPGVTSPFPAGVFDASTLPPAAPSRAWLKLEEAIRTFALPVTSGQSAVDIGCAPGGASYALLQRGLSVIGIDPNDVDDVVLADKRFDHVQNTSTRVEPIPADWVLLDVNVPPGTALRGALPFIDVARVGIVLTLKMKDWSLAAEVPGWLRRLRGFDLVARQLSSNGQEICVAGVRRR
jgi:23S rRNA (cytidine2498-2'-O)-methyltransferase